MPTPPPVPFSAGVLMAAAIQGNMRRVEESIDEASVAAYAFDALKFLDCADAKAAWALVAKGLKDLKGEVKLDKERMAKAEKAFPQLWSALKKAVDDEKITSHAGNYAISDMLMRYLNLGATGANTTATKSTPWAGSLTAVSGTLKKAGIKWLGESIEDADAAEEAADAALKVSESFSPEEAAKICEKGTKLTGKAAAKHVRKAADHYKAQNGGDRANDTIKNDHSALHLVADDLASGHKEVAKRSVDRMDTAVRDVIPPHVHVHMGRHLIVRGEKPTESVNESFIETGVSGPQMAAALMFSGGFVDPTKVLRPAATAATDLTESARGSRMAAAVLGNRPLR